MNNNQNQNRSTGPIIDIQGNETTGRMMRPVAYIKSDFTSKFGIPRQSGLTDLEAEIHFYPEYQNPEAVRGLEEYSHLWLIWEFSRSIRKEWSPTVRPPKLGGNTRVGVFATRSPFRPNPIGLSSVQLTDIALDPHEGPVIYIQGADLLDGTPIYDIKPYIPYAESPGKLRNCSSRRPPSGTIPAGTPEQSSAIKTKTPDPDPVSGSTPRLSAGSRKSLRIPIRRSGNQVPRRRRNPVCMRGK